MQDRRTYIQFCIETEKNCSNIVIMLQKISVLSGMSEWVIFKWYKSFENGCEEQKIVTVIWRLWFRDPWIFINWRHCQLRVLFGNFTLLIWICSQRKAIILYGGILYENSPRLCATTQMPLLFSRILDSSDTILIIMIQ